MGYSSTNMYGVSVGSNQTSGGYTKELRTKIAKAYGYFAGSLGLTALATVYLSRSPLAYRIHQSPWAFIGVGVIGGIGAFIGTQMISYHQNPVAKHLSWLALIGIEGLVLAPITMLGKEPLNFIFDQRD